MSTTIESSPELVELGRFFRIAGQRFDAGQTAPEMFSLAIDATWHVLAQNTQAHREFTIAHAGQELSHIAWAGHGHIAWVKAYEEAYGPLPEIWFTNADGTLNTEALAQYRETGTVVAEWDCGPKPGPGDGDDVVPEKTTR
ncbi:MULTISPECIES: hypothetical protein [unclassified Kitasatospora]|uniref:hypothetical protein n=1 Tax=unclassified Kitasatospora TaxID=2633591 RepID=UPI0036D881E0